MGDLWSVADAMAMPLSLPNLVTIGRILLVPLTVWLLISEAYVPAVLAFALAGISDAVDGFLARRFNLQTELGTYLDPLADKALLVSIYVTLSVMHILPAWITIAVVTRDLLIVGAVMLSWLMDKPLIMKPLWISKVNTAWQIVFAGGVLGFLAIGFDAQWPIFAGALVVGVLTALSGAFYMRDWVRHMSSNAEGKLP
jgi:cardiolipin synthase (CMP-forming)